MSRISQLTEEQKKLLAPNLNGELETVDKFYDTSAQNIKDDFSAQIEETERSYEDLFDQNEVQRIVNERQIAENMSNLGLTDSGLNRTQQTANQLSYSNAKNKLSIQKQTAIDNLARVMRSSLSSLEIEKAQKRQAIQSGYDQLAVSNANDAYKAEQDSQAKIIEAGIKANETITEAQQKATETKIKARNSLLSQLVDPEISVEHKKSLVNNYVYAYGADDNDYEVLKSFGYNIDGINGYTYFDPKGSDERLTTFKRTIKQIMPKNADSTYIENAIKGWYSNGRLSMNDVAELIAYYGI